MTSHPYKAVGKGATLPTPPAWSLGARRTTSLKEATPGPGTYGPTTDCACCGRKGAGFGSGLREVFEANPSPGPQGYRPSTSQTTKSAPGYTFRGKPAGSNSGASPGPGHYDGSSANPHVRPVSSSYTIGHRWAPERPGNGNPGPMEYSPMRPSSSPGATLKFRHPTPDTSSLPGPGAYNPGRLSSTSPGRSFGTSRYHPHPERGLGPGEYDPELRSSKPAWSVPKANQQSRKGEGPGPGQYVQEPLICHPMGHGVESPYRSSPAFSFPMTALRPRADISPGPLDYKHGDGLVRRRSSAFTFRGVTPKDNRGKDPGPGHYDPRDVYTRLSSPAITLLPKRATAGKESTPAGTDYNPYTKNSKLACTLKFRHSISADDSGPGPQDYNTNECHCSCCSNKGKTFGKRYEKLVADNVPGPEYEVGCSTLGVAARQPRDMPLLVF